MDNNAFVALKPFASSEFNLFGLDEKPVGLDVLVESERGRASIIKGISTLQRRQIRLRTAEIARYVVSAIGIWIPLSLISLIATVLLAVYGIGLGAASTLLMTLFIVAFGATERDDKRNGRHNYGHFWVSREAKYAIQQLRDSRAGIAEKIRHLKERLAAWDRIPEGVRSDVRLLSSYVSDYDANVRLYNAEAKRAQFYVERNHMDRIEAETALAAMRETLADQHREVIETVMAADQACIALACAPTGERAVLTPNLEALRERLNRLGENVKKEFALEAIMRKELGPASLSSKASNAS